MWIWVVLNISTPWVSTASSIEAKELVFCAPRITQLLTVNQSQGEGVTSQTSLGKLSPVAEANYLEEEQPYSQHLWNECTGLINKIWSGHQLHLLHPENVQDQSSLQVFCVCVQLWNIFLETPTWVFFLHYSSKSSFFTSNSKNHLWMLKSYHLNS